MSRMTITSPCAVGSTSENAAISVARQDVAGRSDDQRSERPVVLRYGILRLIQRHTHELFALDDEQTRFRLTWMAIQ